jgi:hygromycin-B 7''-O-kinase
MCEYSCPVSQARPSTLTVQMAESLLHKAYPSASVAEVVERTGGHLSTVYEVRCTEPTLRLIIKIYADQWLWKREKEIHVYRVLARNTVSRVPAILHSERAGGPSNQAFTVMTRLDGQPLSEVSPGLNAPAIRQIYRQMGELLASVHRIRQDAYGYMVTGIVDPVPTNAAYMARQFAKKLDEFADLGGDPELHEAIQARVAEQFDLFQRCPAPVLCHNDFHEGNILVAQVRGDWTVTGFIDECHRRRPAPRSGENRVLLDAWRRDQAQCALRRLRCSAGRLARAPCCLPALSRAGAMGLARFDRQ